ncbi:MAG: four helix bundle protein [Candidatus Pacebacteria bacterium]|nr:four helix bundle protein [Candidatus Paceibacterota bacterium]
MIKKEFDQRLYKYAVSIVKCVDGFAKDVSARAIANQLIRSGTSVVANIVEAKGASSRKDYINFYTHSLKSANESKLWIGLARDTGKLPKNQANSILEETTEIANILGASIITMKKNKG